MAGGVDEVEAAVDAVVDNVAPVEAALVLQVLLVLVVDVLDDVAKAETRHSAVVLHSRLHAAHVHVHVHVHVHFACRDS